MILRDLWRLRILVACAALLAVLCGIAVAYRISPGKAESRKYEVGVASISIFLDTPSSQVVEVSPKGSDSLGTRANLLASLMVDGEVKDAIARRAGLRPNQLIATTEADADPSPISTPVTPRSEVLHTRVVTNTVGAQLPIIEIEAQAPNATGAARLANAAVAGLRDYLNSKATTENVTDAKRLMVSGLGAPQAANVVRGPSNLLAMFVAFLVFAAGCACILGASMMARSWRAVSEEEEEVAAAAAEQAGSSDLEHKRAPRWGKRLDEQPATESGAAELMIAERWPRSS